MWSALTLTLRSMPGRDAAVVITTLRRGTESLDSFDCASCLLPACFEVSGSIAWRHTWPLQSPDCAPNAAGSGPSSMATPCSTRAALRARTCPGLAPRTRTPAGSRARLVCLWWTPTCASWQRPVGHCLTEACWARNWMCTCFCRLQMHFGWVSGKHGIKPAAVAELPIEML